MTSSEVKEKDQDRTETPTEAKTEEEPITENQEEEEKPSTKPIHDRQPSISLQSKMRSSSFRRTSVGQRPVSPTTNALKSPTLPPLSPDGDTIPDIYRKQASRLEELVKENKRLEKEAQDAEARWRKTEEELEEAREANSEVVELRGRIDKVGEVEAELARLVSHIGSSTFLVLDQRLTAKAEKRSSITKPSKPTTPISNAEAIKTRLLA